MTNSSGVTRASVLLASILLCVALAGCEESKVTATQAVDNAVDVAVEATTAVEDKAAEVDVAVSKAATPISLGIREAIEAIEAIAPEPLPVVVSTADREAVELVVRWEVGSPARFTKLYQGVICPGGASGPTIGIGYDLGHQTQTTIRRDWAGHPHVEAMVAGSGVVGPGACAAFKSSNRGIRVTYDEAIDNFTRIAWPSYLSMAERAYRNGWLGITDSHRYGIGSNGYNRGFSMVGSRNTEKRHTRDVCVPANDPACTAADLISSCRLWAGTANYTGLCNRRKDEARFVQREG